MNKDEFEGTAKKVEGTVQSAFGNVSGKPSLETKGNAKKVIGSIQSTLGNAEECIEDSFHSVKEHITEKPIKSALIALGIGFILGKISGF